jgi:signal peptidase I
MTKSVANEVKEWVVSIVIAAIIAFVIKGFLLDVIQVSGTSMLPNLHNKDRLIVEKISLYTHEFKKGEIIIFDPGEFGRGIFIKRVIGLPGDRIEIKDGFVYVNGEKLKEDYLRPGTYTNAGPDAENSSLTVPEGCLYVLGDNREVSEDSRYIGPILIKSIKGHAIFRVYPFNQFGKF